MRDTEIKMLARLREMVKCMTIKRSCTRAVDILMWRTDSYDTCMLLDEVSDLADDMDVMYKEQYVSMYNSMIKSGASESDTRHAMSRFDTLVNLLANMQATPTFLFGDTANIVAVDVYEREFVINVGVYPYTVKRVFGNMPDWPWHRKWVMDAVTDRAFEKLEVSLHGKWKHIKHAGWDDHGHLVLLGYGWDGVDLPRHKTWAGVYDANTGQPLVYLDKQNSLMHHPLDNDGKIYLAKEICT